MKLLLENWRKFVNEVQEIIDEIDGIKIRLVSSEDFKGEKYIGCHHYGKKCDHIPVDEIWISKEVPEEEREKIINHELIEREIMKRIEQEFKLTPEEAWKIAHPIVDKLKNLL